MQPGAATNLLAAGVCLLLAACAGAPPGPPRLSDEQLRRCHELEVAYRAKAPEYPALRDELAKDPVTAAWVVRMFVRDLFLVREGRPLGEDRELLMAAARIEDPVEVRALAEIRQLGTAAAPS